jgi:hypothetical protein
MIDAAIWGLCGFAIATLLGAAVELWVEASIGRQVVARRHLRSRDKTVENESQPHSNRSRSTTS